MGSPQSRCPEVLLCASTSGRFPARRAAVVSPEETLDERGQEYGPYSGNAERYAALLQTLKIAPISENWPEEATAMSMIAMKLARLAYQPTHTDSWRDIAGYAHLVLMAQEARAQQ